MKSASFSVKIQFRNRQSTAIAMDVDGYKIDKGVLAVWSRKAMGLGGPWVIQNNVWPLDLISDIEIQEQVD